MRARGILDVEPWRFYGRCFRGALGALVLSGVLAVAQPLLVLPIPLLSRSVFDDLLPRGDVLGLMKTLALLLGLGLASGAVALWVRHLVLRTTKAAVLELRSDLAARLYALPRRFYDRVGRNQLHDLLVQDTERLDVMTNAIFAHLLPSALTSLGLCVVLVHLDWRLFLLLAAVFPLAYWLLRSLGAETTRRVQAFKQAFKEASGGVWFMLRALDLTRSHAAEGLELSRHGKRLDALRRTSTSMAWLASAHGLSQRLVAACAGLSVLAVGGWAVTRGTLSIGELVTFSVAMGLLQAQASTAVSTLPQLVTGYDSLLALHRLAGEPLAAVPAEARRIEFQGRVELQGVCFAYSDAPLIERADLLLERGRTCALLGRNGSGKTTIALLLMGFYAPRAGQILADGHSYECLDLRHLRRRVGYVAQDPLLFAGTVSENIAYGHPMATARQIEAAARLATAHAFVERLPARYETQVGEDGLLLSGGERQRLALARALLCEPALLILDEPTTYLDPDAARELLHNLRRLPGAPAILVITHDPELAQRADRAYVLRDGRVSLLAAGVAQGERISEWLTGAAGTLG